MDVTAIESLMHLNELSGVMLCGGCGTRAVSDCGLLCREPEALPFCALAYALIGIISTVLVSIPTVQAALLAVTA